MIYKRAFVVDCAYHTSTVFPVVFAVSCLTFLSKLLSESAAHALPPSTLGHFLVFTVLKYAPQLLVASLFTGMLLATARAFASREMDAWFTAGIGLRHFVAPALTFATPLVAVILVFSLFIAPWAGGKIDALRGALIQDINAQTIIKNAFVTVPGLGYVYFWQTAKTESAPDNIFIAATGGEQYEVIFTDKVDVDRALNLSRGKIYRLPRDPAAAVDAEILSFDTLQLALPAAEKIEKRARTRQLLELTWQNPRHRAEIIWRFNVPLTALSLALLSLVAAFSYPGAARSTVFLVGIAFFFINLNMLYYVDSELKNDNLAVPLAFVLPPLVVWSVAWLFAKLFRR